mgnify:CR=1 FL=1
MLQQLERATQRVSLLYQGVMNPGDRQATAAAHEAAAASLAASHEQVGGWVGAAGAKGCPLEVLFWGGKGRGGGREGGSPAARCACRWLALAAPGQPSVRRPRPWPQPSPASPPQRLNATG